MYRGIILCLHLCAVLYALFTVPYTLEEAQDFEWTQQELKRAQEELKRAHEELERAQEELKELKETNATLQQLTCTESHANPQVTINSLPLVLHHTCSKPVHTVYA